MVIGNGMIAQRFMDYNDDDEKIIFASGVSNSRDRNEKHFFREFELLKKTMSEHPEKTLVYFSTCSIEDADSQNAPYVIHKKAIELFIQKSVPNYHLFRVSNVAGTSNNPYTLLNYFVFNILQNNPFAVWKNAYRNIIGIDDMHEIATNIIEKKQFLNTTINIANPENYSVPFIVQTIEYFLGKNALITEIEKGDNYEINTTAIAPIIKELKIEFDKNYLTNLLKKYYHSR
jgi:nucleoside-diphosphate-sugar epimerase